MYKKIVLSAFAKARTETAGTTKTQWADQLAECLWSEFKYQISRRTLLNYYNHYMNATSSTDELYPKPKTIEFLCKYLCYPNYATFLMHNRRPSNRFDDKTKKITYTLDNEEYKEQVTILIRRELRQSLSIA